jgi:hypothetical protein
VPPVAKLSPEPLSIITDGESILFGQNWKNSVEASPEVEKIISKGAEDIPLEAPGTCLIIQKDDSKGGVYTALMMDPGYLAPTGVATTLISRKGNIVKATDMVTGEELKISGNCCALQVQPGAFRVIKVELVSK